MPDTDPEPRLIQGARRLPYDPAKDEKLPWEDEVAAAIEELRAEKEAEQRKKD